MTVKQKQLKLRLSGWVRNLDDNRVEAVFEGTKAAVEEMIRWCHKGSSGAVVEDVAVEYAAPEGIGGGLKLHAELRYSLY